MVNVESVEFEGAWSQFFKEGVLAIRSIDGADLKEWCSKSLGKTLELNRGRVKSILGLIDRALSGAWGEFIALWRALVGGRLTNHLLRVAQRLFEALKKVGSEVRAVFVSILSSAKKLSMMRASTRQEFVVKLFAGIIGFVTIGGMGDGGIIDMDIALMGIGAHRSIFTHSLVVGVLFEFVSIAMLELLQLLYIKLPPNHSHVWSRLLRIAQDAQRGLVGGVYIGLATHLAIDAHVGGWTPYKDLPVSLPKWAHQLVMDMNAAGAGFFAWHTNRASRFCQRKYGGLKTVCFG